MKKTVSIFSVMVMSLLCVSLSFGSKVTKIHHSQGQAEMPFIRVLDNGDLLVVFSEGHHFNMNAELKYTIYHNGSWSPVKRALKKTFSSCFVQLVKDETGHIHAALMDGNASTNREIFYASYNPDSDNWFGKYKAYSSAGVNSTWPRLKLQNDKILIVWTHNYDPQIGLTDVVMIENFMDGDWPVEDKERITISNTGQSVSVHNFFDVWENQMHCIWMDDDHKPGNWNMYYTEGSYNPKTGQWSIQQANQIFPSAANQYYPALATDESGTVHIVFSNRTGPFWYAQKPQGGNWTKPVEISTNKTQFTLVPYMEYAKGLLHLVWPQTTSNGEGLFYGRALPDGTWADPIMIADGMEWPGYPTFDVDQNGDVHLVFSDGDPDSPRHIYYSKIELPGEPPEAIISVDKTEGLIPLTVNFNGAQSRDPDGEIKEYRWDFGDGATAKGKRVSHTYTEEGFFTASLTVIDNDIRTGTAEVLITASSGKPVAVINASSTSGMVPLTVVLDGSQSSDFDGDIVSYDWNLGDGTTATGVEVMHEYIEGGKYSVTLTVTDNDNKTDSDSILITAFQKPVAAFTAEPMVGKVPLAVSFDGSKSYDPDGQVVTWRWDFSDGIRELSRRVTHTFSTAGNFPVYLQVVDNDGYTDTTSQVIRVLDKPLPPLDVTVQSKVNRTFMYTDYINYVTWTENPDNAGLYTIANYRIYRKPKGTDDSQYTQVGEVGSGTFEYNDRGFPSAQDASGYQYAVTSLAQDGSESGYHMEASFFSGSGAGLPDRRREKN